MGTPERLLPIATSILNEAWNTEVKRIWVDKEDKRYPIRLQVGKTTFSYRSLDDLTFTLRQIARLH